MSSIKFVSHESFPEDQYTKELVYLLIDDKYRVGYVRKQAKNGGMFWSTISQAVQKDGQKAYYEAFMQDSQFLEKDIKLFLDQGSWKTSVHQPSTTVFPEIQAANNLLSNEDLPF
jgi:hypothetical protein